MAHLTAALLVALVNFALAAYIFLSLRGGWIVPHEPSGIQQIVHLMVTAPVVIATSIWFYILSVYEKCRPAFWKINSLGMIIAIITYQDFQLGSGADKFGLLATGFIAAALIFLYALHLRHYARS